MPMDAKTRAKLIAQEEKAWSLYNIENIRSQLETQIEKQQREQQFRDDMAAAEAARIDAEVQARLKEQQQAQAAKQQQQKQAGQQKSLTEEVPSYNINAQNPTGNLQQGFEMPRPGGGVPPFTSGPRGPGVPGSADEMMGVEMPGVGAAPPFLVNQQRTSEVAPYRFSDYLVAPARTNRVTTNIAPNAMTAGERVRALQENWRLKQNELAARRKELEDKITAEAEDLGGIIFSEDEGEIEKGSSEARFSGIIAQYGKPTAARILMGARAHSRTLELDRRKSQYQSELVEGRQERGEKRRAKLQKSKEFNRPSQVEKDKASEIHLRILEGKEPTEAEKKFLDAYEKANPLDIIMRRALSGSNVEKKIAKQEDLDRIWEDRPSDIETNEQFRGYLESLGYVIE